jgi:hypothetical protein
VYPANPARSISAWFYCLINEISSGWPVFDWPVSILRWISAAAGDLKRGLAGAARDFIGGESVNYRKILATCALARTYHLGLIAAGRGLAELAVQMRASPGGLGFF